MFAYKAHLQKNNSISFEESLEIYNSIFNVL